LAVLAGKTKTAAGDIFSPAAAGLHPGSNFGVWPFDGASVKRVVLYRARKLEYQYSM